MKSSRPEASRLGVFKHYELPRHSDERTIVFEVQYAQGHNDLITVWLSPDLTPGAIDENQPGILTTKFKSNASFGQIRLRHGGGENGSIFSDMAVATSFLDFLEVRFWQTRWFIGIATFGLLAMVGINRRGRLGDRRRKYRLRLPSLHGHSRRSSKGIMGNMRRRAEAIGGMLKLEGEPRRGTPVGMNLRFAS